MPKAPLKNRKRLPVSLIRLPPQPKYILPGGEGEIKDGRSEEALISIHIKKWGDH